MAMKLVKKTAEHRIYQRGDNRYAVQDAHRRPVNGEEKARILAAEGLISVTLPTERPAEEEPAGDMQEPGAEAGADAGEAKPGEAPSAAEGASSDQEAPEEGVAAREETVADAASTDAEAVGEGAEADAGGDEDGDADGKK